MGGSFAVMVNTVKSRFIMAESSFISAPRDWGVVIVCF
jgi:hypothetical protein